MWVIVALTVVGVWLLVAAATAYAIGHAVRIADRRRRPRRRVAQLPRRVAPSPERG